MFGMVNIERVIKSHSGLRWGKHSSDMNVFSTFEVLIVHKSTKDTAGLYLRNKHTDFESRLVSPRCA